MTALRNTKQRFVVCVRNDTYPASLERAKIYRVLPDADAQRHHQLRVIDESGEDYLYPASLFLPIELPAPIKRAMMQPA